MKQLLQYLTTDQTNIVEAPAPPVANGFLLINTSVNLILAGTERMLVDFGKAYLAHKARQKPDRVKMVLEKVKTDGLITTINAVRSKLSPTIVSRLSNVGVCPKSAKGVQHSAKVSGVGYAKTLCASNFSDFRLFKETLFNQKNPLMLCIRVK